MPSMIHRLPNPPPVSRSRPDAILRTKLVLVSMTIVAAMLLVLVTAWPIKLIVMLAFARGLFAAGIVTRKSDTPGFELAGARRSMRQSGMAVQPGQEAE